MNSQHKQKNTGFRHLAAAFLSWQVMFLSVLIGVAACIAVFFGAAFIINTSIVLFALAACAGFLITTLIARVAARMMKRARPGRIALSVGAATMLLLALVSSATILKPLPSNAAARQAPPVPAGVRYWNLSTGSRIAYLEIPAKGKAKPAPVILVGGGPGEEDVADTSQTQFFGQLAELGYNVYFYDQIGSGLSARLANPGQYTLARQVADLEAIRTKIEAQQIILMGESWGGSLTANYMAAYPQHVAKAIFTSPAPIDYADWPNFGSIISRLSPSNQKQANQMLYTPRFILWYLLGDVNPKAATSLVSNQEADEFFNTFLQFVQTGTVCNPAHLPQQIQLGNGFYDNIFTTRDAGKARGNINPLLRLENDRTPTLILTGACNYISWASTWQYKTTFPDSTLLFFPRAGHVIYLDQPDLYLASIRAFLLGEPLPLQPWTSPEPPATFQGPVQ
jgi:pimeloyl-ACP methyl ester carboxylesterase